jgi:hypothetical protein
VPNRREAAALAARQGLVQALSGTLPKTE